MTRAEVPNARDRLERRIIERARDDATYAELLRRNPRAAVEAEFGDTLPDDLKVLVIEESPTLMCVVIPAHLEGIHEAAAASMTGEARKKRAQKRTN